MMTVMMTTNFPEIKKLGKNTGFKIWGGVVVGGVGKNIYHCWIDRLNLL